MVQVELGSELEEQLNRAAQARGLSLNDYLRQELEAKVEVDSKSGEEKLAERRAAIEAMKRFSSEYKFTLGPELTIKDLVNEGRR